MSLVGQGPRRETRQRQRSPAAQSARRSRLHPPRAQVRWVRCRRARPAGVRAYLLSPKFLPRPSAEIMCESGPPSRMSCNLLIHAAECPSSPNSFPNKRQRQPRSSYFPFNTLFSLRPHTRTLVINAPSFVFVSPFATARQLHALVTTTPCAISCLVSVTTGLQHQTLSHPTCAPTAPPPPPPPPPGCGLSLDRASIFTTFNLPFYLYHSLRVSLRSLRRLKVVALYRRQRSACTRLRQLRSESTTTDTKQNLATQESHQRRLLRIDV